MGLRYCAADLQLTMPHSTQPCLQVVLERFTKQPRHAVPRFLSFRPLFTAVKVRNHSATLAVAVHAEIAMLNRSSSDLDFGTLFRLRIHVPSQLIWIQMDMCVAAIGRIDRWYFVPKIDTTGILGADVKHPCIPSIEKVCMNE